MSMISVTLPDGSINEYTTGITAGEIVIDIEGRKHDCVAAMVDGEQKDFSAILDADCTVTGISAFDDDGMYILRHSAAHLLAQAITSLYPDAKPTIGPPVDRGFYYDFADLNDFGEADLKAVQKKMHELARRNLTLERIECTDTELEELFASNPYKLEIIKDKLEEGAGTSIYQQGDWYDLCLGPHVHSTAKLMHVRLTSVSSAFWRGDQSNEQLTRIYGIVEPTKESLKSTLSAIEAVSYTHLTLPTILLV